MDEILRTSVATSVWFTEIPSNIPFAPIDAAATQQAREPDHPKAGNTLLEQGVKVLAQLEHLLFSHGDTVRITAASFASLASVCQAISLTFGAFSVCAVICAHPHHPHHPRDLHQDKLYSRRTSLEVKFTTLLHSRYAQPAESSSKSSPDEFCIFNPDTDGHVAFPGCLAQAQLPGLFGWANGPQELASFVAIARYTMSSSIRDTLPTRETHTQPARSLKRTVNNTPSTRTRTRTRTPHSTALPARAGPGPLPTHDRSPIQARDCAAAALGQDTTIQRRTLAPRSRLRI
ncbi:hypothetical protein JHW43_006653 [Diplocarpon mali]|nr:hypothetical protein JHW43_006653 [Diplocarpon mali]